MNCNRDNPPSAWSTLGEAGLTKVTDDIYYGWIDNTADPTFWHWCPAQGRWVAAGTQNHQLVSREPLHLEPSLLWNCCGLHGWVRNGQWESA